MKILSCLSRHRYSHHLMPYAKSLSELIFQRDCPAATQHANNANYF